jgi:very-short-patch-repair endonuclease
MPRVAKPKEPKPPRKSTKLEMLFHALMAAHFSDVAYIREYRFAPPRMWRFDVAIPERKIAIELEGGIWTNGRHSRGSGMVGDCDKYNTASLHGWRVYRFTINHLRDTPLEVIELLRKVFYDHKNQ